MAEYLMHWWNGELGQFYQPWGYSMTQINKIFQIAQYLTGLLTIFEIVRITDVTGKLRLISTIPMYGYRFLSVVLNSPNLALRLIVGTYLSVRGRQPFDETLKAAFVEHLWTAKTEAEEAAKKLDSQLATLPTERFFSYLESHLFSETAMRLFAFLAFLLLSLAQIFTDPL